MKASTKRHLMQEVKGVAWTMPALVFLITFCIYPMINAIITSFYNWNLTGRKKFIGIYNYRKLFRDPEIWETIGRTVEYALYILPATMILGFILALLFRKSSKLNVVFRTLIFMPRVSSMVAISMVWLFIFNPQYGLLNQALGLVGIKPLRWLNEKETALFSVALVTIWRMVGYSSVVYLGGIQNISEDVLEASTIDGANSIQSIWHIVLPLVSPTTFMLLILNTIEVLKLFTTISVLTGGGPAQSTQNLIIMLHEYAFKRFQVGYASAIALVIFVLILSINLIQMAFERFVSYDS